VAVEGGREVTDVPADDLLADTARRSGDADASHDGAADDHGYGVLFWVGALLGWVVIAYGAILLFGDEEAEWFNTVRLVAIGVIAHDVIWLAVSVGSGWLLSRVLGREIPFWVRWGGWTTAIIVAMWLPVGRRYGDRLNNDTIIPRNYTNSIIALLVVIWVAAAAYGLIDERRSARGQISDG
jgi:hypothetical protein